MILLTRDMILGRRPPTQDVPVPEWGEGVQLRVQQWTVGQRNDYLNAIMTSQDAWAAYYEDQDLDEDDRSNVAAPAVLDSPALAVVMSLVDEEGQRLFTDADAPIVNRWPFPLAEKLYRVVLLMNRLNDNTAAAIELEKKD